jgi:predicted aspartyl protease
MGLTHVDLKVRKDRDSAETREVRCLVDTGATATVLPASILQDLGIRADDEQVFRLEDGTRITRPRGWAFVVLEGQQAYTRVVFGDPDDSSLIGVITLEILELFVDPLHRQLHHIEQQL